MLMTFCFFLLCIWLRLKLQKPTQPSTYVWKVFSNIILFHGPTLSFTYERLEITFVQNPIDWWQVVNANSGYRRTIPGKRRNEKTVTRTEGRNTGLTLGNDFVFKTNQELAYNGEFRLIYMNHSFILNKLKVFAMLCIFAIIQYPSRCTQWGKYPKLDCTIGFKVKMKSERFPFVDSSCRRKLKYNVIRCAAR